MASGEGYAGEGGVDLRSASSCCDGGDYLSMEGQQVGPGGMRGREYE